MGVPGATFLDDALVARADDAIAIAGDKLGAATVDHRFAFLVHIGTGDVFRAADHDAVGAADALAGSGPGDKEVIPVAIANKEGGLDGPLRSRATRRWGWAWNRAEVFR